MALVNHLETAGIRECFHRFRESRVVLLYVGAFLFCVPLKLHNLTIPYLYSYGHIHTSGANIHPRFQPTLRYGIRPF